MLNALYRFTNTSMRLSPTLTPSEVAWQISTNVSDGKGLFSAFTPQITSMFNIQICQFKYRQELYSLRLFLTDKTHASRSLLHYHRFSSWGRWNVKPMHCNENRLCQFVRVFVYLPFLWFSVAQNGGNIKKTNPKPFYLLRISSFLGHAFLLTQYEG